MKELYTFTLKDCPWRCLSGGVKKTVAVLVLGVATMASAALVVLDSDRDCQGQGAVFGSTDIVDLAGHTLAVDGMAFNGAVFTDSSSGPLGELHVAVEANQSVIVSSQTLSGNLKLVKTGSGRLSIPPTGVKMECLQGELTIGAGRMIHRWSFTDGSLVDSIGGSTAVLVGSKSEEVTLADNAVTFPGGGNGECYLDLGADMIPSSGAVTIEVWGTQNQVKDWSRIWNIGVDGVNFLSMAWSNGGKVNSDFVQLKENNSDHFFSTGTLAPYTVGTKFHVSMKITPRADGKTDFVWAKRDAATGEVIRSGGGVTKTAWTTAKYAGCHFWLNHGFDNSDAAATYDEVRIWDYALSEMELNGNAKAGPDKIPERGGSVVEVPEVIHRWSFTGGSLADSVGGSTAVLVGGKSGEVALTNNAVTFPGGGNGECYLDLGADVLPASGDVTIEIWGTQNQVKDWSRIWCVGIDTVNFLSMAWSNGGKVTSDFIQLKENNSDHFFMTGTMAPYTEGTQFHISMKICAGTDGKTNFFWAKRDTTTGEILKSGSGVTKNAWSLANFAGRHFWLNHGFDNSDAAATYDEVRIWKGAVPDRQLTLNAQTGPDEFPEYVADAPEMVHRWSFTNGSLTDSVGNSTAVPVGEGEAIFENNAITFPGGDNGFCYLDMGADVIPASGEVTIEVWGTQNQVKDYSRIWNIGTDGVNFLSMAWSNGGKVNNDFVQLKENKSDHFFSTGTLAPYTVGTKFHISMKIIPRADGKTDFIWAKRDAATGEVMRSGGGVTKTAWTTAKYAGCHFWLNHGFENSDAAATYDEVRIWRGALSENQLTWNARLGPDTIAVAPTYSEGACGTVDIASGAALSVPDGATSTCKRLLGAGMLAAQSEFEVEQELDIAGNEVGSFTVNGVLKVKGDWILNCGAAGASDRIVGTGTLDLSEASLVPRFADNATGPYLVAEGLTLVGYRDMVLPPKYQVEVVGSKLYFKRIGLIVYVR